MLWIDTALVLILLLSLVSGFRCGILVQLCGLAGLAVGVFLAIRLGAQAGAMMGLEGLTARVAGFAAVLLCVMIAVAVVGYAARGLFRLTGLGVADRVGGAVLGAAKAFVILSLLAGLFDSLNRERGWVDQSTLSRSRLYGPMVRTAGATLPWFETLKETIADEGARDIE